LAYLHPAAMKSHIDGIEILNSQICDICTQAKHKQKFIHTKVPQTMKSFKLVHSDTCGPFGTAMKAGHLHYILFIDDYTRCATAYLLPDKKQETCIAAYQYFQAKVDAHNKGYKIKLF
jgi:hypothetical protein